MKTKEQELRQEYVKDLKNLETEYMKSLNNLCALVGVDSKDTAQESMASLIAGIDNLKAQAGKTQTAQGARAELEKKPEIQEQNPIQAIEIKASNVQVSANADLQGALTSNPQAVAQDKVMSPRTLLSDLEKPAQEATPTIKPIVQESIETIPKMTTPLETPQASTKDTETPTKGAQMPQKLKQEANQDTALNGLRVEHRVLQGQKALETLMGNLYADIRQISATSPEVEQALDIAQTFDIRLQVVFKDLSELMEDLPNTQETIKDTETLQAPKQEDNPPLSNTAKALEMLESVIYAKIAHTAKADQKKASELELRAQMVFSVLDELKGDLSKALAQVKAIQEQAQKGSGGKHI
ncbi:hypothetical protein [Helicobacter labacensis]|uniref:hypothetical protein n=1 Tax=Helicobacter labacensis TaxID=2316079 RepID=UPI001F3EE6F8|nr:hypothetical protein [Helicobacter labacensis]